MNDATAQKNAPSFWENIQFDSHGLVPAIAQDAETGEILMLAWANKTAIELTLTTGFATYWSRSRQKLWKKGEESGHRQQIHAVRLDCDGDALLYVVTQHGGIACHTGRKSCFYQRVTPTDTEWSWESDHNVLKTPEQIYRKA